MVGSGIHILFRVIIFLATAILVMPSVVISYSTMAGGYGIVKESAVHVGYQALLIVHKAGQPRHNGVPRLAYLAWQFGIGQTVVSY